MNAVRMRSPGEYDALPKPSARCAGTVTGAA